MAVLAEARRFVQRLAPVTERHRPPQPAERRVRGARIREVLLLGPLCGAENRKPPDSRAGSWSIRVFPCRRPLSFPRPPVDSPDRHRGSAHSPVIIGAGRA
ncbi:hypothetical protein QFZ64_005271 [Streptomyces sp. B3I8]|nr:hypothetical protein [Streptomyces sp. B3I8]